MVREILLSPFVYYFNERLTTATTFSDRARHRRSSAVFDGHIVIDVTHRILGTEYVQVFLTIISVESVHYL